MNELDQLKLQLCQIQSLIEIEPTDELESLKSDLEEAISLKESIDQSIRQSIDTSADKSNNGSGASSSNQENEQTDQQVESEEYDQLVGESYNVPFILNGNLELHEAEIIRVLEIDKDGDARLLVKFLFPLNESMKTCEGCNDKENCNYLHDYVINLSMIKNSLDADNLRLNHTCLYREPNDTYWNKGRIIDKKSNQYFIRSNDTQEIITLELENIAPFKESIDTVDEIEVIQIDDDEIEVIQIDDDDDEVKNVKETKKDKPEGEWAMYSGSIGLRLMMKKMNWTPGEGLGKTNSGIVKPIELSILPRNTSLDACIELKDRGLLSTTSETLSYKKQKNYFKNLILSKNLKRLKSNKEKSKDAGLFNTLNQSLANKTPTKDKTSTQTKIQTAQRESKNVENLNVKILDTEKAINRMKGEILHLRKSLKINQEVNNKGNVKNLRDKLNTKESEVLVIEMKLKALKEEKKRRDYNHSIKYF